MENAMKKGTRVYLDFLSHAHVDTDGEKFKHFGVIESIEYDFWGIGNHLVSGLAENGRPFSCSSTYVTVAEDQNSAVNAHNFALFESWVKGQDEYHSLLINHGERLFIRDADTGYRNQTMRIAFKAWLT